MDDFDLRSRIRDIPDFPRKGIMFRDITTLLRDVDAMKDITRRFLDYYKGKEIDVIAAQESRGFIFGSVLAHEMGKPFVPIRKKGRLPWKTVAAEYEKEYGPDALEAHEDSIVKGEKVLIVDDLLATGGTSAAAAEIVEKLGGEIAGFAFIMELSFLKGRERLEGHDIFSLVDYRSEE